MELDDSAMDQVMYTLDDKIHFMKFAAKVWTQQEEEHFAMLCNERAKRYEKAFALLDRAIYQGRFDRAFSILAAVENMRLKVTPGGPGVMAPITEDNENGWLLAGIRMDDGREFFFSP